MILRRTGAGAGDKRGIGQQSLGRRGIGQQSFGRRLLGHSELRHSTSSVSDR